MTCLSALQKKKAKLVIGLISGTFAEGIDAALVRISSGGALNRAMMEALRNCFHPVPARQMESIGISSDAKEAICFAVLANETIHENTSNVLPVTGARRPVILGTICLR